MDENRPLDIFLQPSKRLIIISLFFILACVLLLYSIPVTSVYKSLLFFIMIIGIGLELRLKIFLTSSASIIRLGYDGGVVGRDGCRSDIHWWYQCRSGAKQYGELSANSRVWVEWVSLDFTSRPWWLRRSVLIARDSVENPEDFQRLKRTLRSR